MNDTLEFTVANLCLFFLLRFFLVQLLAFCDYLRSLLWHFLHLPDVLKVSCVFQLCPGIRIIKICDEIEHFLSKVFIGKRIYGRLGCLVLS